MERTATKKVKKTCFKDQHELIQQSKILTSHYSPLAHQFPRYASSIIQILPAEKADQNFNQPDTFQVQEALVQQSLICELQSKQQIAINRNYGQSKNSRNAEKTKRKTNNRRILAYNFSNVSLLYGKINELAKKRTKSALAMIKIHHCQLINQTSSKNKKQNKRCSDLSGYTTSTSNDEKPTNKKGDKNQGMIYQEVLREGANQIKGCIQFKMLMLISFAFNNIKSCLHRMPFHVSQVSTIKCLPLQINQNIDHSMSMTRQIPQNISKSLVEDLYHNFNFTQKEMESAETQNPKIHPKMMKRGISYEQSFVQCYKPRQIQLFSPKRPPLPRNIAPPRQGKPIKPIKVQNRKNQINVYQLPLLSQNELKCERQLLIKEMPLLADNFVRSQLDLINKVDYCQKDLLAILPKNKSNHIFTELNHQFRQKPQTIRQNQQIKNRQNEKIIKKQFSKNVENIKMEAIKVDKKNSPKGQQIKRQVSPPIKFQNYSQFTQITYQIPKISSKNEKVNAKGQIPGCVRSPLIEEYGYRPENIYHLNCNQQNKVSVTPRIVQKISQPQIKILNNINGVDKKFIPPVKESRPNIIHVEQKNKEGQKKLYYSPQVNKQFYQNSLNTQIPLQTNHLHHPSAIKSPKHENKVIFTRQDQPAVNFSNNYYFMGSHAVRPLSRVNEPNFNVFQNLPAKNNPQPPIIQQSTDRINIFSNYSPLDSQILETQRSNRFRQIRSDFNRPKSMNQKIFVTLRKEK